jgi:hypothetical protein
MGISSSYNVIQYLYTNHLKVRGLTPLIVDFISLPGVFATLKLATTPSRSTCKNMTPAFVIRRERMTRRRCQSWIALFLFVA